ncbi:type IX secretion system anionic LPS delivery protein PorZ [Croceiramulus getboli]|nr:two-component regulator propeller domain-containing protein [Flavobacteriaceae bacterium YJPT1-3]
MSTSYPKLIFYVLVLLISAGRTPAIAQDFSEDWTGFFSYNTIKDLSYGDGRLYAGAESAVFSYDLSTQQLVTFSTINGLAGQDVSNIYYSPTIATLFVGYANGVIDIVREGQEVFTVVDILNQPAIAPTAKSINHLMEYEGVLYMSTNFGISLYELDALEFDDSYFIGDNGDELEVRQTTVLGDYIYAATSSGIRRALVGNDNTIDFANWETVQSGSWSAVLAVGQELAAVDAGNTLYRSDGINFNTVNVLDGPLNDLSIQEDGFTLSTPNTVQVFDANFQVIIDQGINSEFPQPYSAVLSADGFLFSGTNGAGVLLSTLSAPEDVVQVLPEGPSRNNAFALEAIPGELWTVYGDYNVDYNPFPLTQFGLSHFIEGSGWTNYTYTEALSANNMVNITINPENPQEVYISSYNSGLLQVLDRTPIQLFDETNSALSDIPVNPTDVRINGAAFDREGNLWMTNSQVENALARKSPADDFQGFSVAEVIPDFDRENGYGPLVIDRQGNVYFGASNSGLIGYDPQGSRWARVAGDDNGANLPVDDVRALALDNRGTLWIGTTQGLRLLFAPASMFSETVETTAIIILDDGIPAELLNDQSITDIVVDGSNNKWVATAASGVFYFSANGQETLARFDNSNSPLPSNNVQDISIDDADGTVYFATNRGIVSFRGSATAAADDLSNLRAFPNPVRPGFSGLVTIDGLTTRANVKITDIEGNLVYEAVSEGGSIQWDTTAFGRHKVASGVYLILVTGEDAVETKVAKLMIVR